MAILLIALSFISGTAHAQPDLRAVQEQLRGVLHRAPAPAGLFVPAAAGVPVGAPAQKDGYKGVDFTLKDLSGKDFALSEYQGRYVLLDFSATWCGPCNQSIARLEELENAYKGKGLSVLAVYSEDADTVKEHMKSHGATYKVLADPTKAVASRYLVRSYPTFLLIGPDGTKLGLGVGRQGIETLLSKYKAAVGEQ